MTILVTGASGFIGSHICLSLLDNGYRVVGIDNLSNSNKKVINLVNKISAKPMIFIKADINSYDKLQNIFKEHPIEAVIHLAALKSVAQSVKQPLKYHLNNVGGLLQLLKVMDENGCHKMVFSSSATIYGAPQSLPIPENQPFAPHNPYGTTKVISEYILKDYGENSPSNSIISLRYFNPAGAHKNGLLGEFPIDPPANLFPALCRAYRDPSYKLKVFGDDYDTKDGSAIRDIFHIEDLVRAHVLALKKCSQIKGYRAVNLGSGKGWSVLEIIKKFEAELGQKLNYEIAPRREGDIAINYASTSYAKKLLGWEAKQDIEIICRDTVRFIKNLD